MMKLTHLTLAFGLALGALASAQGRGEEAQHCYHLGR